VELLRPGGRGSAQIVPVACRLTAMAEDPTHSAAGHRGLITVFGGTGFLGRRIVRHLLDHRFQVRAASRHPEPVGSASQADAGPGTTKADIHDETTVAAALFGAYGAVNAVSLYVERGRETFDAVHVEAAARVARLARENGVERLIHVSGIGADPASSAPYIAARGRGEIAVQQAFPCVILIRPAVMFGPDDAFLTTVVRLLRILPVYPMFGRGETKLQPVYVEDVAEGIARVLAGAGGSAASYEFAGARVYTYEELVRTVADRINARRRLVPLPFALWRILRRKRCTQCASKWASSAEAAKLIIAGVLLRFFGGREWSAACRQPKIQKIQASPPPPVAL
jgi:uncharacterized protein YbjT (DUF2867 family)